MRYFYVTAILEVSDPDVTPADIFKALKEDAGVRADLTIETAHEITGEQLSD